MGKYLKQKGAGALHEYFVLGFLVISADIPIHLQGEVPWHRNTALCTGFKQG